MWPAASYPVRDPVGGNNVTYVSHIYPGHWLGGSPSWYKNHITTCAAVHPVFMSEWGFSETAGYNLLQGAITNYGQPLMDFIEGLKISSSAWIASPNWEPSMFWWDWTLRCGEGEMGCFVKDTLYLRRNDDQPILGFINFKNIADFAAHWRRADCCPQNAWCSDADYNYDGSVLIDDLQKLVYYWLDS